MTAISFHSSKLNFYDLEKNAVFCILQVIKIAFREYSFDSRMSTLRGSKNVDVVLPV